jgi:hypothetical protein
MDLSKSRIMIVWLIRTWFTYILLVVLRVDLPGVRFDQSKWAKVIVMYDSCGFLVTSYFCTDMCEIGGGLIISNNTCSLFNKYALHNRIPYLVIVHTNSTLTP